MEDKIFLSARVIANSIKDNHVDGLSVSDGKIILENAEIDYQNKTISTKSPYDELNKQLTTIIGRLAKLPSRKSDHKHIKKA
jgi:hypothetical protein